ncbi:MAG: hypothetical protein ABIP95_16250 [Pelobium sp.]
MKKLIISSLFLYFATTTLLIAKDKDVKREDGIENVSSNVLQQFGYNFYKASNISWTVNKTYQKATFLLNGKTTYAIYDLENKFLVSTQLIEVSELPEKVQESLSKEYKEYKILNVLKVVSRPSDYQFQDDTNAYWIDLSSKDQHLFAVSLSGISLTVVKTEKTI